MNKSDCQEMTSDRHSQQFESRIQDDKRNIFLLRSNLIQTVIKDIKKLMKYQEGSTQFVSKGLVQGENINLF